MLQDDPEFNLDQNFNLPVFDFDDEGNLIVAEISQVSRKTSSQLSPLERARSSASGSFHGALNIPPSSDQNSPFFGDPLADNMVLDEDFNVMKQPGDDESDLHVFDDWGIQIDADGNIIEEPELPHLPKPQDQHQNDSVYSDLPVPFSDLGDFHMGGIDPVLPSDAPVPANELQQQLQQQQTQMQSPEEEEAAMSNREIAPAGRASVRVRRARQRRVLAPDNQTMISRRQLQAWNANYLANVAPVPFAGYGATPAEARNNAFNMIFGRGLANVGFPTDGHQIFNPMAVLFAGDALQAQILGFANQDGENPDDSEGHRHRRRSAAEALELEEEENSRRVRPRLSSDGSRQDAQVIQPLDEAEPGIEAGRAADFVLPDLPSDVPWNRPSSQIPSSSVKGGGGLGSRAGSRQVSASPLIRRSRGLEAIERFSDQPMYGSDGLGDFFPSQGGDPLSSDPAGPPEIPEIPVREQSVTINTSQAMLDALDREGRNFHVFIQTKAKDMGYPDEDDVDQKRRWVDFDQLFEREDRTRAVVVQAFHHVLTLATKNIIKVQQEGQGGIEPFGIIRVGVKVPDDEGNEGDFDIGDD